jgi:membrane-bound ClpP family serine protease
MKNPRLIIAIITSLLDEAIVVALIVFGLPRLGVNIPTYGLILIGVSFIIYAVGFYIIGSRILRKKPMLGFTNMVGLEGRATTRLAPEGYISVKGELWQSRAETGTIKIGSNVIIVLQDSLKLVVRLKATESQSNRNKPS